MTAPEPSIVAPTSRPVLGMETSCDETAVGIVQDGAVLANRIASQVALHARFGGVVPEVAARNHLQSILPAITLALADANLRPADLGGIAVTSQPGLIGALLVGVQTARTLALCWNLPVVGVDHIEAHVWAAMLRRPGAEPAGPSLPFLALAVSGGHTSLYRVEGPGQMHLLGRTLDDAAGEAYDKFARLLSLPYPGGPEVDRLAQLGDPQRFSLPRGMRGRDDLAMSFSGLKTAARLHVEAARAQATLTEADVADLCASFQHAVVGQLTHVTRKAALQHGLRDVVVAGGVAANAGLRASLAAMCQAEGLGFWPVPLAWCGDNGAMVAGLGEALLARGVQHDPHGLDATPTGLVKRGIATRGPG